MWSLLMHIFTMAGLKAILKKGKDVVIPAWLLEELMPVDRPQP